MVLLLPLLLSLIFIVTQSNNDLSPPVATIFADKVRISWIPAPSGYVDKYEVQRREVHSSLSQWETIDMYTTRRQTKEIQIVRTRADPNSIVTSGAFRLNLNYDGVNDFDPETRTTTDWIPYNASASEMRDLLGSLINIGNIKVTRGFQNKVGLDDSGPNERGEYQWFVTFSWDKEEDNNNFPELSVLEHTLNAQWTLSPGGPVMVYQKRMGGTQSDLQVLCTSTECHVVETSLIPGKMYEFRVRAHSTQDGWTSYSITSGHVRVPLPSPVPRPFPPRVLSSTSGVSLSIRIPVQQGVAESCELEYRKTEHETLWTSFSNQDITLQRHGAHLTAYVTLNHLDEGSKYEFRARGIRGSLIGLWSATSDVTTIPISSLPKPVAPVVTSIPTDTNSLNIAWTPPLHRVRQDEIKSYDLEIRRVGYYEGAWNRVKYGIKAYKSDGVSEVQIVRVVRTPDQDLASNGKFKLAFDYKGSSSFDVSENTITPFLSVHSTQSEIFEALSSLSTIMNLKRVERRGQCEVGCEWIVTFDKIMGNVPRIQVLSTSSVTGGTVQVIVQRDGIAPEFQVSPSIRVDKLKSYVNYQFRVRVNPSCVACVSSDWSEPSNLVRTLAPDDLTTKSNEDVLATTATTTSVVTKTASDSNAIQQQDPTYAAGVAHGGSPGQDGMPGLVVIETHSRSAPRWPGDTIGVARRSRTVSFFYRDVTTSASVQSLVVPRTHISGHQVTSVTVKAWGGGGGGGSSNHSYGGAGGFVQAELSVVEGETLQIVVGGGGQGCTFRSDRGGQGGFNGGGHGGSGEFGAGGGGGASEVRRQNGEILLLAGGGGGGGSSNYCCAHGGGGGGTAGQSGSSPESSTPRDNTNLAPRDEFNDERDETGMPGFHQHVDLGSAPNASYDVMSSSGSGGTQNEGGRAGRTGSLQYGSETSSKTQNRMRNALAGSFRLGGDGAWGKEAGGGGGGGYFGGGGGGAGIDGAGGGGGSGFVLISALYRDPRVELLVAPERPVLLATHFDHNSVTLSWSEPDHAVTSPIVEYVVEMSEAHNGGSEDFYQIHHVVVKGVSGTSCTGHYNCEDAIASSRIYTATPLIPEKTYRFRVAAGASRGGLGPFSDPPLTITTKSIPANKWSRVVPRNRRISVTGGGRRNPDSPTSESPKWPSPRRGHTSTMLGGHMYMFGGVSRGYRCDRTVSARCEISSPMNRNGTTTLLSDGRVLGGFVSNELWRYDVVREEWTFMMPSQSVLSVPPPRERHSAVNIQNRIFMFGGRANNNDDTAMNDMWILDPMHLTEKKLTGNGGFISDGRNLFLEMNTTGHVGSGQCIVDVNVKLHVTHDCTSDLRIWLLGPGPRVESTTYRFDDNQASDERALLFDGSLHNPHPWRYGRRQEGVNRNTFGTGCGALGLHDTIFDDDADRRLQDDDVARDEMSHLRGICTRCREGGDEGEHAVCQRPGTGTCHLKTLGRCHNGDVDCSSVYTLSRSIVPQEPLSRFYGLELSDNDRSWTLKVEDGVMNNLEGRVNSWELDLVLEPCRGGEDEFTWTQVLNSSSSNEDANVPPPRYDHSAVVVGNSMFLFGGFSDVVRNDLWRFDVFETRSSNSLDSTGSLVSGSWTELMYPTASTTGGDNYYKYTPPRRYGRVSLVTPWGILSVGGLKEPNTDNNDPRYANTLTIHNPILRTWKPIQTSEQPEAPIYHHRTNEENRVNPRDLIQMSPRYLHSAVLIGLENTTSYFRGIREPRILVFGGHDDTEGFLDDLWELRLNELNDVDFLRDAVTYREENCKWRFKGEGHEHWMTRCVNDVSLGGTGMCSVEDIIQRSYCEGTGSSYYRFAQDEIDTGFQPNHVPSYFAL